MSWWICKLMRLWVGGLVSLWVDVFVSSWAFMSLSASELFYPALRIWELFLFCVGIPKITSTSQLVEILKVWTTLCCIELKQAVEKWLKDGSNKSVWFTCLAVKGKFKACSKKSPQRFNWCSLYCSSLPFCFCLASFAFSFSSIVHYALSRSKQNLLC